MARPIPSLVDCPERYRPCLETPKASALQHVIAYVSERAVVFDPQPHFIAPNAKRLVLSRGDSLALVMVDAQWHGTWKG
nr:hypothetical protein [Rhizobium gei]